MIKRFTLFFLLILPVVVRAQTPIIPSWTRQATQISILDTIGLSYSGQITKQYFGGTAWTRQYMVNKADTNIFSATRYWVEHQPHIWYADQTLHGTLIIPDFNTGIALGDNSIVRTSDQLSINLGDRNGLAINYFGNTIARFSTTGHAADQGYTSIDTKVSLRTMVNISDYGTAYDILARVSSAAGGDEGLIGKIPTSTFSTPTQLNLKQPRIISALPTQTTTRPLVGDSVNQAFAKEIFRGDSLASAVSLKLNISDTSAMAYVHKAKVETITGAKTFSATNTSFANVIPTTDATSNLGGASNRWSSAYILTAFTNNVRGLSGDISFIGTGGTTWGKIFNTTGNFLLQSGGTFTDGGQRLQVGGRIKVTQGLSGSAGTDSLLVHDNTSKEFKLVSPTYYAAVRTSTVSSASTLTLSYAVDYSASGTTATFTLPAISSTLKGRSYSITIKNRGSGNLTVNSSAGGNDIYTTSAVATFTLTPGQSCELINDGTYLNYE